MLPTKIVCIGAGSASFGLNVLATLLRSERLRGSHLALVDTNPEALATVTQLAHHLNQRWASEMVITSHTHHTEALDGADFVILAIEVAPREALWQNDFRIPLRHGVRQPYAENGGPGGFAHAARNIPVVMNIVRDMERVCPQAWLINYTNPMQRICDAVNRYSKIRVIGLCHQIGAGYAMVGKVLSQDLGIEVPPAFTSTHSDTAINPARAYVSQQAMERVAIQAAGVNHFTWMLQLHDRRSGEDLYPLFRQRWEAFDPAFEPLTRRVFEAFGLFPIPGDEHLCEYLPWVSDPITQPWEKYQLSLYDWEGRSADRLTERQRLHRFVNGEEDIETLRQIQSEGAVEVIEHIAGGKPLYWEALNLPNRGYIPNLPSNAIVEVPGVLSHAGAQGVVVEPLPAGIAELVRREITVSQLCVDAVIAGDRQLALQALLLDPVIRDIETAKAVLEDYLTTYRKYLTTFWMD